MSNKAYHLLAVEGLEDSFWGKRIVYAEQMGEFTFDDEVLVDQWDNRPSAKFNLWRVEDKHPEDNELSQLEKRFKRAILHNWPLAAARALIAIDNRSAIVQAQAQAEAK